MNRKVQILSLGLMLLMFGSWNSAAGMYVGAVQFPRTLKKIPSLPIYFAGNKIPCNLSNESKQITFNIPSYQRNTPLYILVTEHIQWNAEENTIKYLKVNTSQPYKLYLVSPQKNNEQGVLWETQEQALDCDGKIPDNTLIIVFNPTLVEGLEGGNSITLPRLCTYSNLLERIGTEEQLHAMTEFLLLAALDTDSIHKKIQHTIKPHYQLKTVLALTTT